MSIQPTTPPPQFSMTKINADKVIGYLGTWMKAHPILSSVVGLYTLCKLNQILNSTYNDFFITRFVKVIVYTSFHGALALSIAILAQRILGGSTLATIFGYGILGTLLLILIPIILFLIIGKIMFKLAKNQMNAIDTPTERPRESHSLLMGSQSSLNVPSFSQRRRAGQSAFNSDSFFQEARDRHQQLVDSMFNRHETR